ncbi:MAG: tripartite tricarboxylate transporter substrate binding protein [Acetobacteraceae bacterium]|nr:tripartite tricarboxylate transporter substrate binding protein [Acetobacteraceae bacterium]MSP29516.1 tripartite tricarboxylate transporter substrate binding protein [Acetobacteraceae bacterium]
MFFRILLALGITAAMAGSALAAWPEKPVKLVVPYPAGGAADLPARVVADGLQRKLGKPFIVENRAGASGQVGTESVVRSVPDGYTLYCGPNAPMVLLPQLRSVNYKASDLTPVAPYGELVYAFGVLKDAPYNNLQELITHAKANPGKLTFSSPGVGTATHLRGEAFNMLAGVQITHIPYRTGAEALPDMLAGRVDMMIDNLFFQQVRIGQVKMLGVISGRRHPEFPQVATFAEQGYQIEPLRVWGGIHAPLGVQQEIMDIIAKAMAELNVEPEVMERMLKIGFVTFNAKPAELREQMKAETETYRVWVERTKLKLE